ncbi:MAG: DUF1667 domain-containing protein [Clostridia bacterium]|nr:DUF1667 domain-containing protein [Clostridia bacterium]
MKKELTCIGCPMGCRVNVEYDGGHIHSVTGNTCPRGEAYARNELTSPTRMVTALVRVSGTHAPLSVKTKEAIPKDRIFDCLAALRAAVVTPPVHIGDVVLANACGTGVDVVATENRE